jgi:two-component system chemotaxis response regulator CheB
MAGKIIVIGASAGGLSALRKLFSTLDPALTATIFTVVHMSPTFPSYLVPLLSKSSTLPIRGATNGEFEPGVIYIAPPDHHLVIEWRVMSLSRGSRENRARPAIDVTFRSAAIAHGHSVVGVVLTGMLDDGTAGLFYVKRHGGIAIVQDPQEAEFASMPANALTHVNVDYSLPLDEIGPMLNQLGMANFINVNSINRTAQPIGSEAMMMEQDKQAPHLILRVIPVPSATAQSRELRTARRLDSAVEWATLTD